jgi:hypothetical protein
VLEGQYLEEAYDLGYGRGAPHGYGAESSRRGGSSNGASFGDPEDALLRSLDALHRKVEGVL